MGWTVSAIFAQAMLNPIAGRAWSTAIPTGYSSLSADVINAALFGTTPTPNKTDTLANSAYGAGQWVTGNEVSAGGGTAYTAGGQALSSKSFSLDSVNTNQVTLSAVNPSWTGATIAAAYGDLVYDNSVTGGTVAKQGLCFNYFGGTQSVTAGTFCHSAATEIMTGRGWLRYDQVTDADTCLTLNTGTGLAEWQPVEAVHTFTGGPYDVIRLEGAGHASVSTPDHRWPAVVPGEDGIRWFTTATLPPDAQLLISETERTDKVADLTATPGSEDLVWCVQTPARTWLARLDGTCYFTGNTVQWGTPASSAQTAVFYITV